MSATSPLARAILDALCSDPAACDELRGLLQIEPPQAAPAPDRWMNSAGAADYLGITRNALHKHTSARTIPFEQSGPNGKLWFRAVELDDWRRGRETAGETPALPKCFQTRPNHQAVTSRVRQIPWFYRRFVSAPGRI